MQGTQNLRITYNRLYTLTLELYDLKVSVVFDPLLQR